MNPVCSGLAYPNASGAAPVDFEQPRSLEQDGHVICGGAMESGFEEFLEGPAGAVRGVDRSDRDPSPTRHLAESIIQDRPRDYSRGLLLAEQDGDVVTSDRANREDAAPRGRGEALADLKRLCHRDRRAVAHDEPSLSAPYYLLGRQVAGRASQ